MFFKEKILNVLKLQDKKLDAATEMLKEYNDNAADQAQSIDALIAEQQMQAQTILGLTSKIEDITIKLQGLDDIAAQLQGQASNTANLVTQIDGLAAKQQVQENTIADLTARLTSLAGKYEAQEKKLNGLFAAQNAASQKEQDDQYAKKIDDQNMLITKLADELSAQKASTSALQSQVSTTKNVLAKLQNAPVPVTKVEKVDLSGLEQKLLAVETRVGQISKGMGDMKAELATAQERLEQLDSSGWYS